MYDPVLLSPELPSPGHVLFKRLKLPVRPAKVLKAAHIPPVSTAQPAAKLVDVPKSVYRSHPVQTPLHIA